ncbi:MAG: polyphosphate kinase 1 [Thiotrichales bacterium]
MDLNQPELYINRELSLLEFNQRVLELAQDESFPLLERLRFLCISSSNLDEFFEVRVSGLKQHITLGISAKGPDGLSAALQMQKISERAHELVAAQYTLLNKTLKPQLEAEGVHFLSRKEWSPELASWVTSYFKKELLPLLSPIGLDPAHPFPRVTNKSLNFIITLDGKDAFGRESRMAIVTAPRALPRMIQVPDSVKSGSLSFVFLSSVLHAEVEELFPGMQVTGCYQFRVTRNTNLFVDEEDILDLRDALAGELPTRNFGDAVRLEVADNCTDEAREFLREQFQLDHQDTYQVHGPVNLNRLSQLYDLIPHKALKFPHFEPGLPEALKQHDRNLFDVIKEQEIVLHHPYQSFAPVIMMLRQAANDPDVLSIKQTLYRSGTHSELVELLGQAARNGKEVTAVVELKARFDEENNIEMAERLQEAGCQVVYGVVGHKTHAKMLLIVRRERGKLKRYVHLGTGNYHAGTAKAYTDTGLITADSAMGNDVHRVFQQLTGLGRVPRPRKLLQAPFTLHKAMLKKIEREAEHAREGRPAHIKARMNSLVEPEIIAALYRASEAGVKIDLLIRGVCCLRPGVKGVSDHIRVRSVMGRFLEHSRVFYFENSGESELYCSSADWMPRNFFRRIETCFPIENPILKQRVIRETLDAYFADNQQAWQLKSDGSYHRIRNARARPFNAQEILMRSLGTLES